MKLQGKIAIVTGTSPNIGGGIAQGLADEGDTLEVVAKLAEMMREPQRSTTEPGALATPESPAASAS